MKKPKNYWSRQELKTHFAGVNFFKSKSDHPFHLKIHREIRSCLGDELYYCPISANDTFTDGVYKNRIIDRVYVKLDGVWYDYKIKMFDYYMEKLNVMELDVSVHNAILAIVETGLANKKQKTMAQHIKTEKMCRDTHKSMFKSFRATRLKLKELKAKMSKGESN